MALPPSRILLQTYSKTCLSSSHHAILGGARRPQGAAEAGGQEAQARGRVRDAPGGRVEAHPGKTGERATMIANDVPSFPNAIKGPSLYK